VTISEEIQDAMKNGASAMFLIGLLCHFKAQPMAAITEIERAAESVRRWREAKIQTGR
jgi:hypothetical protein